MSAIQLLGAFLIALPFLIMIGFVIHEAGVYVALTSVTITAAVVAVVCLGSYLLVGA